MNRFFIFILLILFSGQLIAQTTTKTSLIGTVTFSGFSSGGTSDVTGSLINFNDQTNQYFANQIQIGDVIWDNIGQRWEVMAVSNGTLTTVDVDLRAINGQGGTPMGSGYVNRETPNVGLSVFVPDNNIGISQQLKSRVESHNMMVIDSALAAGGSMTEAGQGLTKTGDTIDLGGVVDQDVFIDLNQNIKFNLGSTQLFSKYESGTSFNSNGQWTIEVSRFGNYVVLWGDGSDQLIRIYDISVMSNPTLVHVIEAGDPVQSGGSIPSSMKWFSRVDEVGDIAFAASDTSFVSIDFSNPSNPIILDIITTSESPYVFDESFAVIVYENYAYLQKSVNSPNEEGFIVFDVSNPSNITAVGQVVTPKNGDFSSIWDFGAYEDRLYVAMEYGYVKVFDISNPLSPTEIETIDPLSDNSIRQIEVYNGYLYAADGNNNGISIYDISQPSSSFIKKLASSTDHPLNFIEGFSVGSNGYLGVYASTFDWNSYAISAYDLNDDPLLSLAPFFSTIDEVGTGGGFNQTLHIDSELFALVGYSDKLSIWSIQSLIQGFSKEGGLTQVNGDIISVLASEYLNFPSPFGGNGLNVSLNKDDSKMDSLKLGGDLSERTTIRLDDLTFSLKNENTIERLSTYQDVSGEIPVSYEVMVYDSVRSQIYASSYNSSYDRLIDVISVNPNGSMQRTHRITDPSLGSISQMQLKDSILFAGRFSSDSILVFGVNPDSIELLGKINTLVSSGRIFHIDGNNLYLNNLNGVSIYDISDPLNPSLIGKTDSLITLNAGIRSIYVDQGLCVFDASFPGFNNRLFIVDVSDPVNPITLDSLTEGIELPSISGIRNVYYNEPYIYFSTFSGSTRSIWVADATDPSNLIILDNIESQGGKFRLVDDVLIVGTIGSNNVMPIYAIDISNPSDLKIFDTTIEEFPEIPYPLYWFGSFDFHLKDSLIYSTSPSGIETLLLTHEGGFATSKFKTLIDSDTIDISGATTLIGFPGGGSDGNGIYSASGNMFANGIATLQTPATNTFKFQTDYNGTMGINLGSGLFKNAEVEVGFYNNHGTLADILFSGTYKGTGSNIPIWETQYDDADGGDWGFLVNDAAAVIRGNSGSFILHSTNGNYFSDTRLAGSQAGIEYAADYSAGFTNRSLVDKEYVDGLALGGGTNFYTSNGSLSGNRVITGGGFNVDFDNTGTFEIDADQFQIRNSGGLITFPPSQTPSDVLGARSFMFWEGSGSPGVAASDFVLEKDLAPHGQASINWITRSGDTGANVVLQRGDAFIFNATGSGGWTEDWDLSNLQDGDIIRVKFFGATGGDAISIDPVTGTVIQASSSPGITAFIDCGDCDVEFIWSNGVLYAFD